MKLVKDGVEYTLTDKEQIKVFLKAGYSEVLETMEEETMEEEETKKRKK